MHFVAIPERTEKSIFATKGDSLPYVQYVVADGGIVAKEIKNRSGIGSCSGWEFGDWILEMRWERIAHQGHFLALRAQGATGSKLPSQ